MYEATIPHPDVVVVPASSGGTLAGLRVGWDLYDVDTRVVGVRVFERYATNRLRIARLASNTAALCERSGYSYHDVELLGGYLGEGYGEPTPEEDRVSRLAEEHGLTLDPT